MAQWWRSRISFDPVRHFTDCPEEDISVFSKFDRLRQSVQRVVTDRAVFLGGVAVLGAWYTGMMVGGGTKGTGMLEVRVTCILDKFFCPWTHCEFRCGAVRSGMLALRSGNRSCGGVDGNKHTNTAFER